MKLRLTEPPDQQARTRALDPSASFIVQAPAGSGKTELLIQRILALLGGVRQPEEVLAITFTRKAAGEMRHRLVRALEAAREPEPEAPHARTTWRLGRTVLENDARHGWRLLENPVRLSVQTIDSFCASLVRRMPWLSRFGAQAAIVEDAGELYGQAAERVLALADGLTPVGQAACVLLAHLDNRMARLRDLLTGMLGRRDQWLRHLRGRGAEEQRVLLEGGLRCLADGVLERLHGLLNGEQRAALAHLGGMAAANLQDLGVENGISRLAGVDAFPAPAAEDLERWRGFADLLLTGAGTLRKRLDKNCGFPPGKKEPFASMKQAMGSLLEELGRDPQVAELFAEVRALPPVVYESEQWQVLQALTELLPRAVAELWLVFRESGQCDFVEVAMAAGRALGEVDAPTDLLLSLDSRIRHILVDEFQDTSWGQYLLLKKLTAGWQSGDGRSLFLVGDPMQSIYRFREAEVGLYLQARQQGIEQVRLEPLFLTTNFRSQAGVVAWVNEVFPELFPPREDEALGGVTYAPSVAAREALDAPAVSCHPLTGRDDRAEALQVVELVRQARRDDPRGTVAVLVRARTHLAEILRAFREAGLRFRAQEIDPLACRPVARDLLALTSALLHPADRIAHLAVLRAPWCGLELADLHALCGETPDATLAELLRRPQRLMGLSAGGRKRLERFVAVWQQAPALRGRVPLRGLVEGVWLALGGPGCLDEAGLADAEAFFGLLEQLDHGGDLLPYEELVDKLKKLYAAADPLADDSLQVMTIHKAKGLEFDTVILPGLGRRPRTEDAPLMRWLELPQTGLLLAPLAPPGERRRDPIYDAIGRIEKQKSDLEVGRILYVAATRARKRLHLLGHAVADAAGDPRPAGGSFLEKLWPAVAAQYLSAGGAGAEYGDVPLQVPPRKLLRLPDDWQLPAVPAGCAEGEGTVLRPSAAVRHPMESSLLPETEEGRHVGTLVHAWLERIATDGVDRWNDERIASQQALVAHRLAGMGVADDRLAPAVARVQRALNQTLASERGRWILAGHAQAACEFSLSGVLDGQLVHAEIDRTFVDERDIRWVVDYKTGENRDQDADAYLRQQAEVYRGQLAFYVRLMQALEPGRTVRAALYFPLLDGWITLG